MPACALVQYTGSSVCIVQSSSMQRHTLNNTNSAEQGKKLFYYYWNYLRRSKKRYSYEKYIEYRNSNALENEKLFKSIRVISSLSLGPFHSLQMVQIATWPCQTGISWFFSLLLLCRSRKNWFRSICTCKFYLHQHTHAHTFFLLKKKKI